MDVAYAGRPLGRKTWIVTPLGVDQIERYVRAGVREQARALATRYSSDSWGLALGGSLG